MKFIVLLAAIAPPLLLLSYGIGKARASWRSEAIWNAFLIGAVSAIALVTIELGLAHLLPLERAGAVAEAAFKSVLIAAIPEEAVKFFVLVYLVEKHVDVRRLQDRLVLALAVSLGFATLENFGYAVASGGLTTVAALRAITAVPGHAIDGLAMGALLIRARLSGRAEDLRAALIVPVVLHAFYDFPLMALQKQGDVAKEWFSVMWLVTIAVSAALVIPLCNRMLAKAVDFDSAAGRDQSSTEVASWLIAGGTVVLIAGPLLAAWTYRASGAEAVSVAAALSIFPLAFGIDAIRSGVKQRRRRLAAADQT